MVQSTDQKNNLKYIYTIVGGRKIKGLLDTGSQVTIINSKYVPPGIPIQQENNVVLSSASGHDIPILGKIKLPIQIGHLHTKIEVLVVKNFDCPLLISIAVYNQLKAHVDHENNHIQFKEGQRSSGKMVMFSDGLHASHNFRIKTMNEAEYLLTQEKIRHTSTKYIYRLGTSIVLRPEEIQYWKIEWTQPTFKWNEEIMNDQEIKIKAKDQYGIFIQNMTGKTIRLHSNIEIANTAIINRVQNDNKEREKVKIESDNRHWPVQNEKEEEKKKSEKSEENVNKTEREKEIAQKR